MKAKKWVLIFLLLLFLGIGCYMGINYYANPMGYFTVERGDKTYLSNDYVRAVKAKYVYKHRNEIEAVVLGGSKSGALDIGLLSEYTGLKYYNMYISAGNFSDYLSFIRFLAEKTNVKEITLHISSYETLGYDRTSYGNNYKVPAVVSGSRIKRLTEKLSWLMTDLHTTVSALYRRPRNTDAEEVATGMRNDKSYENAFAGSPEKAVARYVTKNLNKHLGKMFSGNAEQYEDTREKSVEAMKQIKKICDEHGITLKVIIGASFIGERYTYECEGYYDYLREMTEIFGNVWDFSSFNAVNMNPYNFTNEKHFSYQTAALMLQTVYGKGGLEGFGQLLTPDNIDEYIKQRRADYNRLKNEYDETGTVELLGLDDPSYIPRPVNAS